MTPLPDDQRLVEAARTGDARAFERLAGRYYDDMFRMAFRWCRNRADAEDITQDACIRLARAIRGFSGEAAFTSWLYRLVISAAVDWQRKNRKERQHDGAEPVSPQASAEAQLYAQEVLAMIDRLPAKEKAAILLVHAEGLSHAEAAEVMEVKEGTISWYIHEGRRKLAEFEEKERKHG